MAADPPPSPLLSVKQTIPPVRAGAGRAGPAGGRLESAATKLTLVVAPAGWGKTSLLSRGRSTARTDTRIAWVSLDESDDEPVRFWSYVLTALGRVSDQISSAALDALPASSDGPDVPRAACRSCNELAAASTHHVLVLDDFHVIADQDVHESLEFLVSYLPPTLRIVIASRADPPLPLARMRVRGELTELRADDLRFSVDESAALLSAVSETELDPTDGRGGLGADRRLGGRPAAGRSGAARRSPAQRRGPLGATTGTCSTTSPRRCFPALAPAQRDLLVRAAPLELLSGSLCDAALGVEGSAAVLAELERADLFVVALDQRARVVPLPPAAARRAAARPRGSGRAGDGATSCAGPRGGSRSTTASTTRCATCSAPGDARGGRRLLRSQQRGSSSGAGRPRTWRSASGCRRRLSTRSWRSTWPTPRRSAGNADRVVHWLDVCDRRIDDATPWSTAGEARAPACWRCGP